MGLYLNPGRGKFEEAIRSQIYIDKTMLLANLNQVLETKQKYICVSRPRRFGKSTTADMITAYYEQTDDVSDMFAPYRIRQDPGFVSHRNRYDVIHINMLDFIQRDGEIEAQLDKMQRFLIRELMQQYPQLQPFDNTDLALTMAETASLTRRKFVIVIDEWDCLFRQIYNNRSLQEENQKKYLDFLRLWLKDRDYIALAYMTGILPIKKYGEHSALNMFWEFSMTAPFQFAEYTGFTDEEVQALCVQYKVDYDEIRDWYDGYLVSKGDEIYHIYCPLSVVNAMLTKSIRNYWNATESYLALRNNINRNFDGLHEIITMLMRGARQRINIDTYQNDMNSFQSADDVLTMLVHLGYLGYDPQTSEVFIPNKELLSVFQSSVRNDDKWDALFSILDRSQQVLEATWQQDSDTVARLLEEAHDQTGNQTYNNEAALSYSIRLAYFNAEQYYTLIPEMQAGKGYADLVYIPAPGHEDKPAMIVELKWGKDANTALEQIHRQNYPSALRKYKGNLLLVGINYNRDISSHSNKFKHHMCIIEKA